MRWQIEPLGRWQYPITQNRRNAASFRASWEDTLRLLATELDNLGCTSAVALRVDAEASDIRQDGMLRARARVGFPGVVVSFTSRHGPLSYATDAYEQQWSGGLSSWQANLRAIALGLEALRAVDRYGITRSGEQYSGWLAIDGPAVGFSTADDALRWLSRQVGSEYQPGEDVARLLRRAARKLHPDAGGNEADWLLYDQARQLLTKGGQR
jgi:hypothetical protein